MHNVDTYTGASFSLPNRIRRLGWNMTYIVLFRYSPRILHGWRNFLLRCFGAKIGRGVHVYPAARIWAPWNLQLGDLVGIGDGVILYCQGKIIVGSRASISQGSHICTGTHDYTKEGHPLVTAPIIIHERAWIAAEVFIHPGVTIGEGAVVGARSVVIKDLPAWMICAGNPCKPIKERIISDK
jgi:putative colanic acid biosynthesis acetyltransferase WcaF